MSPRRRSIRKRLRQPKNWWQPGRPKTARGPPCGSVTMPTRRAGSPSGHCGSPPGDSKTATEMETSYLELSYRQVGVAATLVLVNGAASLLLGLKLGRPLAIASARAVVQLLLVGLVLKSVFAWSQWYVVLGLMAAMTLVAGAAAVGRTKHRYRGVYV